MVVYSTFIIKVVSNNLNKIKRKPLFLGFGIFIIIISGVFIILSLFEVNNQRAIMEEQKQIMDENRQWVERITFWEVTGGLGQNIIESEKLYNEALAKYSAALQAQILAIFLIIMLSIIIAITGGFLFLKFS